MKANEEQELMKIFFTIILLTLLSTGHTAKPNRPEWIDQPMSACTPRELCAVGEALGLLGAEMRAREAIARSFETQVSSQMTITQTAASSESSEKILHAQTQEQVHSRIKQMTEMVLSNVVIRESFVSQDGVFALAVLNKRQTAERLQEEMRLIDQENKNLMKSATRSDLMVVQRNFEVRERLNQFYHFMSNEYFHSPVSKTDVWQKRRAYRDQAITIYAVKPNSEPELRLYHDIIKELLAFDYKVVDQPELPHRYRVELELNKNERHLNVKGFEKLEIELVINSFEGSVKRGGFLITKEQIARNKLQAFERTLPEIQKELSKNINQLNLD
jgi:hypothetical protein